MEVTKKYCDECLKKVKEFKCGSWGRDFCSHKCQSEFNRKVSEKEDIKQSEGKNK